MATSFAMPPSALNASSSTELEPRSSDAERARNSSFMRKRSRQDMECLNIPQNAVLDLDTCNQRIPHGIAASRGGRPYMEDFFTVQTGAPLIHSERTPDLAGRSLFLVADGHGGAAVAEYLSRHLPEVVAWELTFQSSGSTELHHHALETALTHSYSRLDAALPPADSKECGSTACTALVSSDCITVANTGDSRAVLSRGGVAVALTEDHSPERADEQARVIGAGGLILNHNGLRVMGILAMTRAFGDSVLRKYGVIHTPDVSTTPICPHDEFLILATDGLWCVISSQDAVDIARICIARAEGKGARRDVALRVAARVLTRVAAKTGSRDNTTVVVVDMKMLASQQPRQAPCAYYTHASAAHQLQAQTHQAALEESSRYLAHLESSIALSSAVESPPISPGSISQQALAPSSTHTALHCNQYSPSTVREAQIQHMVRAALEKQGLGIPSNAATYSPDSSPPQKVMPTSSPSPSSEPPSPGQDQPWRVCLGAGANKLRSRSAPIPAPQPMLYSAEELMIYVAPACMV